MAQALSEPYAVYKRAGERLVGDNTPPLDGSGRFILCWEIIGMSRKIPASGKIPRRMKPLILCHGEKTSMDA